MSEALAPTAASAQATALVMKSSGEFRRGWRMVLLAFIGAASTVSVTLLYGFGAMVLPLSNAFGWARGDLQIAIACMSGGIVVATQLAGWLNLRVGLRRLTLLSLLVLPLAYLALTGLRGSIVWLYLGFFLVPIAGVGVTFVSWTQLITQWFDQRRGMALAIVLCGSGVAAALLPPAISWAVERWGWWAGFLVMGLPGLVLTLPLTWRYLKEGPGALQAVAAPDAMVAAKESQAQQPSDFRRHVRSRKFWIMNVSLTLVVSAVVGMVTNTVPLLRDMGLSATQAGTVFSSFGAALIVGRLVVGWLIDRFWAPGVAALALALPSVGCAILAGADAQSSSALLALAVALVGVGAGAEFDIAAYLIARYFGLRDYGRLFGIQLGLVTAGSVIGPVAFAAMYKATGGYGSLLSYCIGSCIVGPLLLLTLGRQPARSVQGV
jgi:MFS family permease